MNMSQDELDRLLAKNPAVRIAGGSAMQIGKSHAMSRLLQMEQQAIEKRTPAPRAPGAKRQRTADPHNPLEDQEHKTVADWLTAHHIEFHHSPNGGMRPQTKKANGVTYSREAQKLRELGTKAGFPDILIIDRPPMFPNAPGAVVEMKRRKGGTLSADQKEMIGKFEIRGWRTFVAKGADQAIAWLRLQGYGGNR